MNPTDIITVVNIHTEERVTITVAEAPTYFRTQKLTIVGILPNLVFLVE
jgi:hypothetical protein